MKSFFSAGDGREVWRLWPTTVAATAAGIFLPLVVAAMTGLDTRLVAAFRGSRTIPYRLAFFLSLGIACVVWTYRQARTGAGPALGRAAIVGAVLGYLSGLIAYAVVQYGLISAQGAWRALTSSPGGFLVPLGVPVVTFSWFLGMLALSGAGLVLRRAAHHGQ